VVTTWAIPFGHHPRKALLAISPIADLPRTASGKIQKFKLKEVAAAFAEAK